MIYKKLLLGSLPIIFGSFLLVLPSALAAKALSEGSSAPTQKNSCQAVDLRSQLGPPRDQGDTGWCYAYTSADMVSYKMGVKVSAFDVASAFVFTELQYLPEQDPRWKEFLRLNPGILPRWRRNYEDQKKQLVEGVVECFQSGFYQFGGLDEAAIFASQKKGFCMDAALPRTPKEVESAAQDILDFFDESDSQNFKAALSRWLDQKCGQRIQSKSFLLPRSQYIEESVEDLLKTFPDRLTRTKAQRPLYERINEILDRGAPISIGYSAYDLLDRDSSRVQNLKFGGGSAKKFAELLPFNMGSRIHSDIKAPRCEEAGFSFKSEDEDIHGDHASLIVARKPTSQGCMYFVRNSFGKGCEGYLRSLQSRCDPEAGGAWVTLEELGTIYSLAWL